MSEWLVLALAMAAACAVVLVIVFLNQRRIGEDDDPSETPDVIEYMTMMIGVVYAIVLGLAIAGVWEAKGAAGDTVRAEAQALHEVSERVHVYPAAERERIRASVTAYVRYVVDEEFPHMLDEGELTERGDALMRELRHAVVEATPRDERMAQTYQPLADQVALADDARGARGQSAGATIPGVVWFGLVGGAMVAVGMVFTLQIRRSARELVLAGLFSALIAFLLFLVWDFDAPFGRSAGDAAEPFTDLFPL
ncbi:DUF4239 domain-containing protein [Streptomyces buecherae]|uniref:DUF4239 domain-containing protein n=1 Tax=Streptomyces buecherae TaxID=2763006 RepID=A0A7H8N1W5_9ACTN|nr:DUF4239 domain-containing protein [Streptomyces buecherae]QKW48412.1 DUF4239 domain-containing protein [Streptomyces buecherae]